MKRMILTVILVLMFSPIAYGGSGDLVQEGVTAATIDTDKLNLDDTNSTHKLGVIWNEDDSAARTINLKVNAGDRTLDLSENLTVGGGNDVTITATGAAGSVTLTKQALEIEGEGTATRLMKLANANDAAATLTIEGTSAVVNQDTTSDGTPTFSGAGMSGQKITNLADATDPKDAVNLNKVACPISINIT